MFFFFINEGILVTYQSGKKFDAEKKMFLNLTFHLSVFLADERVREQR